MNRAVLGMAALLFAIALGGSASAHDTVTAPGSDVALSFPEGATISVTLPSSMVTDDGLALVWQPRHGESLAIAPAAIEPAGVDLVNATVVLDFQTDFVPVGITIDFQWHTGSGPMEPIGKEESFDWIDPRWEWNAVSQGPITVWTYGNGSPAGQHILDTAMATLMRMQDDYGITQNRPISIWVYASSVEFSGTRQANAREAVSGVSYPDFGVISAVLPAGQPAEIERVMPHEVSHLVLAHATANPWNHPPLWFDEGLAVYLQTGGTTSYEMILQRVVTEGAVFDLDAIAWAFPFSAEGASRAYAQSWSVVAWMHDSYGVDGVARLIEAFGTGVSWGEAIRTSLGTTQANIERDWRAWLSKDFSSPDARLFETFERIVKPGSTAPGSTKSEQELTTWPSILADHSAQRSSIRLRSSESWH